MFAVTGALTLAIALVIGSTVAIARGAPLTSNLLRAGLIGVCNWLFVAALAWPVAMRRARLGRQAQVLSGWPYLVLAIVVGTPAAFVCGDTLATWLLGSSAPTLLQRTVAQNPALLYVVFLPCIVVTLVLAALQTIAERNGAARSARFLAMEAELRLLESQLDPHMLFNCLASLRELMDSDQQQAHLMFENLIRFLRANLSGSRRALHLVKDEFARLSDFLELMRMRLGDRLSFRLDLPEALSDVQMPALLLQPLVENALRHGIATSVTGGHLHVSAVQEGTHLVLSVRNSGADFNGGGDASDGFGLHHVRERLQAIYGPQALFEITSERIGQPGAIATVRLPMEHRP
ncbi:histidine kinase [Variovorax sp. ZS18.2.2]|uniref:sensor histidine kinase n=1 Tax=Variovorax sp. ZS18.2.2 TaxID=2971255 RepID=UPI00215172BB|nr:histidine kinase [Variovorax sp. ZS18.2.2]MCR6480889.1 histidine kinase [Variovorax sp. ZS18.2.2]